MLTSLSITNFALVDHLEVDFCAKFTTITGKTGSGKSVILDALSWISGEKTDVERLKDPDKTCILEATFAIESYGLKSYFEEEDLDWAPIISIRRTLAPSGKSRTFIQDLPVTQESLKSLTKKLLDIHSQEQNFRLSDFDFQQSVIDDVAHLRSDLDKYQTLYTNHKKKEREIKKRETQTQQKEDERAYIQHQYDELLEADLNAEEQGSLEEELKVLTNAQSIKEQLHEVQQSLFGGEYPLVEMFGNCVKNLQKAEVHYQKCTSVRERYEGYYIEMKEGARELEQFEEQVVWDPDRLAEVTERLDQIYSLQQKHHVTSTEALLDLQKDFEMQLVELAGYNDSLEVDKKILAQWQSELDTRAEALSQTRQKFIPKLETQILTHMAPLGMPHAQFEIRHQTTPVLAVHGKDHIQFYFTGNAQSDLFPLEKVASGGEKARVMLAIKSILSSETNLPTILFDEIDIGVSGAIADRMGTLMQQMALHRQVLTITHLPQVAAKGAQHYCVFKEERTGHTSSHLSALSGDARIEEIAQMLSGSTITDSAREQAQKLLEGNIRTKNK